MVIRTFNTSSEPRIEYGVRLWSGTQKILALLTGFHEGFRIPASTYGRSAEADDLRRYDGPGI